MGVAFTRAPGAVAVSMVTTARRPSFTGSLAPQHDIQFLFLAQNASLGTVQEEKELVSFTRTFKNIYLCNFISNQRTRMALLNFILKMTIRSSLFIWRVLAEFVVSFC